MGTLYVVSTPIGNLEDISFRAVRTLKEADLVAAEDTRRARTLFAAHGIKTSVTSYHSYNIRQKTPGILRKLEEGKNVALISDSGTPGISDPGSVLIKKCIESGISVTAVPGPAAFLVALILSGKPTDSFVFEGFLSSKAGRRKKQLIKLLEEERTAIVYESPHRIIKFLEDLGRLAPEREVVLARELTKQFEEITRRTAKEHLERFVAEKPRGEYIAVF